MSAGANLPPAAPPPGAGIVPTPAKSKTWLWVLLGCGGCALLSVVGVVVLGAAGILFSKGGGSGTSMGSTGTTWTSAAKSCSETCSRVVACEKKQASDDPDAGYQVESQSDCEKDCGGNLQDEPYHCLSQATDCDSQEGCESGD